MKYVLSEEEIAYYRENGFLVIEDFLDPDELEEWRCAVDKACLLYTSPSPRDRQKSRMPSSA